MIALGSVSKTGERVDEMCADHTLDVEVEELAQDFLLALIHR